MAVRTIATDLTLTGEKEFNDQMKAVNSNLKNLKSDMALTTAEFKDNADSTEALTAKQKILQETADQQREKVRALAAMHEKMVRTYGEDSAAADKYYRETNNAKAALLKMEEQLNSVNKQLEENERAQEESTDALADAEKQLEDTAAAEEDYGAATEKASKSNIDLGKALPAAAKGIAAVGAAAAAVIGFLLKLEEETAEYRENLAKLNTAFTAAGYAAGTAQKAYDAFYKILGDGDTATESAQLLAQLADSEEDVAKWSDIAAGVVGTFGDALPINSLIEASNETAKVGQVTGALADALNWVGLSEDEFNAKLAACADEQERAKLITETLTTAYGEAAEAYKTNNAEIMAANEAQAQMDATMAKLGGTVSSVKNKLIAEFLPALSDCASAFDDYIKGAEGADEALQEAIQNMTDKMVEKLPDFLDFGIDLIIAIATGIIQNLPYLLTKIPGIIIDIVKGFAKLHENLLDVGGQMIEGLWEGISGAVAGWFKKKVKGVISDIKSWFTGKDGFDTHSPSKWSEEVFKNVMRGGVSGVEAAGPKLQAAFSDAIAQIKSDAEGLDSLNTDFNITGRLTAGAGYNAMPTSGRVVNITVNTQQLSQTEIDYLINKVNRELGVAV